MQRRQRTEERETYALGMDCAQVGVLEEADQIGLRGFLECR